MSPAEAQHLRALVDRWLADLEGMRRRLDRAESPTFTRPPSRRRLPRLTLRSAR